MFGRLAKQALALTASVWVLSGARTSDAQVPRGSDFRVNTYTTSDQLRPSVATDAAGNFVVVWVSRHYSEHRLFAQRYDAAGTPIGPEFQVNSYTTFNARPPSVALDAAGRMVVVWEGWGNGRGGLGYDVWARRFDEAGVPGPEFLVNTFTGSRERRPSVAMSASGEFVVVWESNQIGEDSYGVFGRRFDAAGTALGNEFHVNTYTTLAQYQAAVAMRANGDFVVAWTSSWPDGIHGSVFGRRYDASGAPQGPEFAVNATTVVRQLLPSVALSPAGDFVVVWSTPEAEPLDYGVHGRRFDAAGAPQGGDFPVNQFTTGNQGPAHVAMDGAGNFVVTWESLDQDGDSQGIFGRAFSRTGAARGDEFGVNSVTAGYQTQNSVAVAADGSFVVAWADATAHDGDGGGIFARRFGPDLIFEDDFESGGLAAWSGAQTDGGDLAATPTAALKLTAIGLRGTVDDRTGVYVEDDSPADENRYRMRFYFDANGYDPGEALGHRRARLFIAFQEGPARRLATIVLRRLQGAYSLMARTRLDDHSLHDTGFFPLTDGPHVVELDWKRASGPDAQDGSFEMWIDGVSVHAATGLDNSVSAVDFVRLGALSVKEGANGTLFWDEFESRRLTYIGP